MDKWEFLLMRLEKSWAAAGKPRRILAAVSGGADSVALLQGLHRCCDRLAIEVIAGHVDHGLRKDSAEDCRFMAEMCKGMHIPFCSLRLSLSSASESDARNGRYEALLQMAAQNECSAIALAHHRKDQAETMLLHLFRGSGLKGLCGMEECRKISFSHGGEMLLWRPLLNCDPEEMKGLLLEDGIAWREDETNQKDDYLRNYIRHRVLPVIAQRIPAAESAIARGALLLQDEEDYLSSRAQEFLTGYACLTPPCRWLDYRAFSGLHPAMKRRILRLVAPVDLDFEQTERLMEAKPGDTINLPENCRAIITGKKLHFIPEKLEAPVTGSIRVLPYQGRAGDGIRMQAMPASVWEKCELRFRKEGDSIHPLGGPGEKSLQDFWVDKKVDRPFRPYLPVLCIGQRVIWSIGIGTGEETRVRPGDHCVLLQYEGYLPGEKNGPNEDIKE